MEDKQKVKKPVNKAKILQTVVILIIVGAMILSAAATLIYYLMHM